MLNMDVAIVNCNGRGKHFHVIKNSLKYISVPQTITLIFLSGVTPEIHPLDFDQLRRGGGMPPDPIVPRPTKKEVGESD